MSEWPPVNHHLLEPDPVHGCGDCARLTRELAEARIEIERQKAVIVTINWLRRQG